VSGAYLAFDLGAESGRAILGRLQGGSLALDEIRPSGEGFGPRLPYNGPHDFTGPNVISRAAVALAAQPLSKVLGPIELDPLTVVDDSDYLTLIENQPNVPEPIRKGLRALY